MKKLFCFADIHGFYDEWMQALEEAGYDRNNPDHWLISCGDHFDRGTQPKEILDYLKNHPRAVCICGNHEDLLLDALYRGCPQSHDYTNGTVETALRLGEGREFEEVCDKVYTRVKPFIYEMKDYFETKNYIFVHGWLPLREGRVPEDWRDADFHSWKKARWTNGIEATRKGQTVEKTVVCGHWHASLGHHLTKGTPEFGPGADHSPFYYEDKLIALDACTVVSGKVNVVVLEDEFLN